MKSYAFYIKKFAIEDGKISPDLSEIPPLVRRRMVQIDKISVSTMSNVFDESVEEIVFASQKGEISRLDSIIEQYKTYGEVSPLQFSASVHNYITGFFTLYKKLNIPYYALSSGKNTLSSSLIKAIISSKKNVMFTYSDEESVSVLLSKISGKDKIEFNPDKKTSENGNEYTNFIKFLNGENNEFKTSLGTFVRSFQ